MTDNQPDPTHPSDHRPAAAPAGNAYETERTYALVVWGLYASSVMFGVTALVGFVIALIKRNDLSGTPYESHMRKAIQLFVVSFLLGIVGALSAGFGIGIVILIGLMIWFLVVTIKGIMRAVERRAYDDA